MKTKQEVNLVVDTLTKTLLAKRGKDYTIGYLAESLSQLLAWGLVDEKKQDSELNLLQIAIDENKNAH